MAADWEDAPSAQWEDAPDMTAPTSDDSPEAAEAKAAIAGGDVLGSVARGIAGQVYGGLAMGGKALTNAFGLTSGDPMETGRAAAASVPSEPLTQGGREAASAMSRGMEALDRPIERAEDYLDPSGNLKATAQDVAERGNMITAPVQAVAPFMRVPGVIATAADAASADVAAAPKAGGFTREEFAPRAPKPKITPKAGETAQEAAARQGVAQAAPAPEAAPAPSSAAPSPKGAQSPAINHPDFFDQPDNQDLKSGSVGPEEQAARQAAVERGAPTLPQVRDSAITNNYADQGRDWTGKQAGDPVATAQIAAEGQALHSEATRISQETGGQQGTGEAADRVRGQAYQDWHDTTVNALDRHIKAAYAAEDEAAKQLASPGSNLKGVLTDDSLIDNANAGSVRSSTIALAKKMGVDLTDPNAQLNGYQIENLRKHANSTYGSAPRLAQAIKNAADADLPSGAYVQARKLKQIRSDMFDNRDGINQLGPSTDVNPATGKPRPENRPVKAGEVMDKIEGFDPEQTAHILQTMKRSSSVLESLGDHDAAVKVTDKAHKAAQQIQSHFTERWTSEAAKGGGWNTRRANAFLRDNQEKLATVLSPEQMHQIRNVNSAAHVLDMDKRYKGAFAQFSQGAGWLRKRLGTLGVGAAEAGLAAATHGASVGIKEGLNLASGGKIDRALLNLATGEGKNTPPKNFTRPLGERLPGQRGAVGTLNRMGTTYDHEPSTGSHVVESPNGTTYALDHENGKDIVIDNTHTEAVARGGGEGTVRMQKLADAAIERGGRLLSDSSVSPSQVPVYSSLAKAGYKIELNPNAKRVAGGYDAPEGEHVFAVSKPILSRPQAGAENVPLGQRPGFRRQAGAVSFGGDIYDRSPARDVWGSERKVNDRTGATEQRTGNPYESGGGKATPLGARIAGGKQRGAVGDLSKTAEPEGGAKVNIGLHVNGGPAAGGSVLDARVAKAQLKAAGVKVGKTSIQNPEGGEPTLVADINRPLNEAEANTLAQKTGQDAIAQRHDDGTGRMFVRPGKEDVAAKQGWDKYNPDYFQMHDGRTASQHEAAEQVSQHLTPEEREQTSRGGAIDNVVKAFHEDLPEHFTHELAAMALEGAAKRGWYKQAGNAITAFHGPDAPRFTAVLAAQSPRLPVGRNFTNAMHLWDAWDRAGRPTDPQQIMKVLRDDPNVPKDVFLKSRMNNTVQALTHSDPGNLMLSGPKVNSFHRNLMGNVLESTNDGWMAAAGAIDAAKFGGSKNLLGPGKSATYLAYSAHVRAAAERVTQLMKEHGVNDKWTAPEIQETVWSWFKTALEHSTKTGESVPEVMRRGEINDELIRSTPDFHSLFGSPELAGIVRRNPEGHARLRAAQDSNTETPTDAKAREAARRTLQPHLANSVKRVEALRQARGGNVPEEQVPF